MNVNSRALRTYAESLLRLQFLGAHDNSSAEDLPPSAAWTVTPADLAVPAVGLREQIAAAAGEAWAPVVSVAADSAVVVPGGLAAAVFAVDVPGSAADEEEKRTGLEE